MTQRTTMCFYCLATGVPMEQNEDGKWVKSEHTDDAHGTHPCAGSGT